MSVFMICERVIGMLAGNRLELTDAQRVMLENLDYEGLTADRAQSEAVTLVRHFPFVRDGLLASYAWAFARRSERLAEMSEAPDGWGYAYVLPPGCLRVLELISEGRGVPVFEHCGNAVACDYPGVTARYTARVTDVKAWPLPFIDAFCARAAAEASGVAVGNIGAAGAFRELEAAALAEAHRSGFIDEVNRVETHQYGWDGYSS